MNSNGDFVQGYVQLLKQAREITLGGHPPIEWARAVNCTMPTVAIFSPHPDDEILAGAPLAMRFREEGCRIINVAMTLGRKPQRMRRRAELERACSYMGFDLVLLSEEGFDSVSDKMLGRPEWAWHVKAISTFLEHVRPNVIIVHHTRDWHPDHQGTALMVRNAIERVNWDGVLFEAEYWREMEEPNMMLEVSTEDLGLMLNALSFHKGELERNPYHLRWPALLSNNVRRSEIILGRGTVSPEFDFAAMYRRNVCMDGAVLTTPPAKGLLNRGISVMPLIPAL